MIGCMYQGKEGRPEWGARVTGLPGLGVGCGETLVEIEVEELKATLSVSADSKLHCTLKSARDL